MGIMARHIGVVHVVYSKIYWMEELQTGNAPEGELSVMTLAQITRPPSAVSVRRAIKVFRPALRASDRLDI